MRTYHEQKGLTLQAGWKDRVDFGLDLCRNIPISYQTIPIPVELPRVLTPIELGAWEAREAESGVSMDICRVCHIRSPSISPLSPDKESQSEERKSVIDAVKQITAAQEGIPGEKELFLVTLLNMIGLQGMMAYMVSLAI